MATDRFPTCRPIRESGFTLIELMIAVAIVAILAAVAIPSYRDSVWKGRRGEAKAAILRTLQTEERWYTQNNQYKLFNSQATATQNGAPFSTYSADNASNSRYTISVQTISACSSPGTNQCAQVVATVNGPPDPKCGSTLSMDTTGVKLPTTPGCW